jgi:hypothetical protein
MMFNYLHDSTSAEAAAIRAVLVDGANSILETGDLTPAVLSELEGKRVLGSPLWDRALCITVQDAGEEPDGAQGRYRAFVVVRVMDRKRGYRNIRATRIALCKAITPTGIIGNLYRPAGDGRTYGGALIVEYAGRTGHRSDPNFGIEYEALSFEVVYERDS